MDPCNNSKWGPQKGWKVKEKEIKNGFTCFDRLMIFM